MTESVKRWTSICADCSWFSTNKNSYRAARRHSLATLHKTTTEKVVEMVVDGREVLHKRNIRFQLKQQKKGAE